MGQPSDPRFQVIEPISPSPWLYTAPVSAVVLFSAGIGCVVFALPALLEWYLSRNGSPPFTMVLASDAFAGLLAAVSTYRIVAFARERRRSLRARLQLVADMNHHIRNALEVIQLSAYSSKDRKMIEQVNEAVARIDWALSDLLGSSKHN